MHPVCEHRFVNVNGIRMHIAEQGDKKAPLVICCHGWPELWYSWRHQMAALSQAGYRVVVPDMRGFGQTDAPQDVNAYTTLHLVGDIVALVKELSQESGDARAIVIGHDWGAPVAWAAALLRPDIFTRVIGMSVPHRPRGPAAPLSILKKQGLQNHYWVYFQTPGVAEKEFERDVDTSMRKLIYGVAGRIPVDRENPLLVPEGGGFLDRSCVAETIPAWTTEADLKIFIDEYQRTGFRGGLNWYRNIDRNWELTAPWDGARIMQPALFIGGTRDPVIAGKRGVTAIEQMQIAVPNVQKVMLEGAGHWIQQERPAEVNAALLDFLKEA